VVVGVIGKIIHRNSVGRQPIPDIHIKGKERRYRRLIMCKKVLPNLAVTIGEAVGMRARLREQQQARIFVSISGQQHDFGGLEKLLPVSDVTPVTRPFAAAAIRVTCARSKMVRFLVWSAAGMVVTAVEPLALT